MSNSPAENPTFDPSGFVIGLAEAFLQSTGTPGLAVALIYDGQQYFYNFGFENIVSNDLVSKETIFELGSVTKVFTAIMTAFKIGQPEWNDPITNFLPGTFGLNPGLQDVTINQLITHTSGMPSDAPGKPGSQLFNDEPPSTTLVNWWQTFTPPAGTGPCWEYSNIGFVTLGYIVAGCNPNQYNELLADIITGQLHMTQTGSNPTGSAATGYVGNANQNTQAKGTASDLKSTSQDMMLFLEACINPRKHPTPQALGDVIWLTQMPVFTTPIYDCSTSELIKFNMGAAWQISQLESNGETFSLIAKDGATSVGGFRSWIGVVSGKMGIVLLANKFLTETVQTQVQSLAGTGRSILQVLLDINL